MSCTSLSLILLIKIIILYESCSCFSIIFLTLEVLRVTQLQLTLQACFRTITKRMSETKINFYECKTEKLKKTKQNKTKNKYKKYSL